MCAVSQEGFVDNVNFFPHRFLLLLFVMAELLVGASRVHAQSSPDAFDSEPPLIEHEVVSDGELGDSQSFMATVVDDEELQSVTLFHRRAGETVYASMTMNRLSASATWVARIATRSNDVRDIEYYIEARDESGNRTLRGFIFNPLVRRINPSNPPADNGPLAKTTTSVDTRVGTSLPTRTRSKTVYYVLGVVGVAVIAGLALGQGDDDGDRGCADDGCELVFTVEQPN